MIGNAKYPDNDVRVMNDATNDAQDIADELKRDGFDVDRGMNLTGDGMRQALERFYARIQPGGVALFFFDGFGIQSARQTYLLPVDAQIWMEADVVRDGFNLETILGEMNNAWRVGEGRADRGGAPQSLRTALPPLFRGAGAGRHAEQYAGAVLLRARLGDRQRQGRSWPVRDRAVAGDPRPRHHRRTGASQYAGRRHQRHARRAGSVAVVVADDGIFLCRGVTAVSLAETDANPEPHALADPDVESDTNADVEPDAIAQAHVKPHVKPHTDLRAASRAAFAERGRTRQ